ncbi:MAG TPA: hypothetical protein PLZ84_00150 [Clostridia bacterium]|nr:hypothetical protein [Clostridia bacterium]
MPKGKWVFVGDHPSLIQLSPAADKIIRNDNHGKEDDAFNWGGWFADRRTLFVALEKYEDFWSVTDKLDQDVTDIIILRTAFYCWLKKYKKIKDEMMDIGIFINTVRAACPQARIHILSALPPAKSAPRADEELWPEVDRKKFNKTINKINTYSEKQVWTKVITITLKERLCNADSFKRFNAALSSLAAEKNVGYIDLYKSGLISDEGFLKEEYTAPAGYGLHLNQPGVELLGQFIEKSVKASTVKPVCRPANKDRVLYAGFAQRSIDPPLPVTVQGQVEFRLAREIKYPLFTNVVVLQTVVNGVQEEASVWLSFDVSTVQGPLQTEIMNGVEAMGIPRDHVFVTSTHTHDAPFLVRKVIDTVVPGYEGDLNKPEDIECITPEEYTAFVVSRALDAIREAWENRVPARVGAGTAYRDIGNADRGYIDDGNGNWHMEWMANYNTPNFLGFYNDIDGDHSIEALAFWDAEKDNLMGIVAGVFTPAQTSDSDRYVSSDFWHFTREKLKRIYNINVPMVTFSLFSGDSGPIKSFGFQKYGEPGGYTREEVGGLVADALIEGIAKAKNNIYEHPVLMHERIFVRLPLLKTTEERYRRACETIEKYTAEGKHPSYDVCAYAIYTRYHLQQKTDSCPLYIHAVRLGDSVLGTAPFEVDMPYGVEIKARANYPQVWPIQLTEEYYGYLRTERLMEYETVKIHECIVLVSPEGGKLLCDTLVGKFNGWQDKG